MIATCFSIFLDEEDNYGFSMKNQYVDNNLERKYLDEFYGAEDNDEYSKAIHYALMIF